MKLELTNISKKYRLFYALKDINVMLENGVYGILGANGAGKTTFINILIGVLQELLIWIKLDICLSIHNFIRISKFGNFWTICVALKEFRGKNIKRGLTG